MTLFWSLGCWKSEVLVSWARACKHWNLSLSCVVRTDYVLLSMWSLFMPLTWIQVEVTEIPLQSSSSLQSNPMFFSVVFPNTWQMIFHCTSLSLYNMIFALHNNHNILWQKWSFQLLFFLKFNKSFKMIIFRFCTNL